MNDVYPGPFETVKDIHPVLSPLHEKYPTYAVRIKGLCTPKIGVMVVNQIRVDHNEKEIVLE